MISPVTKTIDDLEITVQPWGARLAFQNQLILGKLLAPALKDLGKAVMTTSKNQESQDPESLENTSIDLGLIGSAFSSVLLSIDPDKADSLITTMMSNVYLKNKKMTPEMIDTIFMGKFETLYKVLWMVVEVNFGSFLSKNAIGRLLKKA